MPFTFGDVRQSLRRKGFAEETDRHHIYLRFYYKGRKTSVYTKCSHGANHDDIRHGVASAMKLQLKLTARKQLDELVECPMSAETYVGLLKAAGVLPKED